MPKKPTAVQFVRPATITIETMSGERFKATDYNGLVTAMRAAAWGGENSDGVRGYMAQVAKRMHDWSGVRIRTSNAHYFIDDLIASGVVKMIVNEGTGL